MALFEMNQISPDWFGDRVVPPTGYCVLPGLSWWPVLNFDWLWSWSCFPMSTKEESVKFLRSTSSLKFYRFLVFSTSDLPVWKRTTRTVAADWSAMVSSHVTHGPRRGRGSARAGHSIGGGVFRNVKFPIHILKWPYPLRCSFTFASGFFFFCYRVSTEFIGSWQDLNRVCTWESNWTFERIDFERSMSTNGVLLGFYLIPTSPPLEFLPSFYRSQVCWWTWTEFYRVNASFNPSPGVSLPFNRVFFRGIIRFYETFYEATVRRWAGNATKKKSRSASQWETAVGAPALRRPPASADSRAKRKNILKKKKKKNSLAKILGRRSGVWRRFSFSLTHLLMNAIYSLLLSV